MTLDIEQPAQLEEYLRSRKLIGTSEPIAATTLQGGVSNRAVLVRRMDGAEWVVKQALAKLRVKVDWFSSPERIHREALALRALSRLAPAGSTPELVFEDAEHHILIMTAVPRPHENWKTLLLRGAALEHASAFGGLLGAIHSRAYQERAWIEPMFADLSFFETLRLEPYYGYTAERVPEAASFLARLVHDTLATRCTLVHGDYSPKNVLVHAGSLVLLDYEVAHFGDPAFDVGFALTHLLSKAHHLPAARQRFVEASRSFWGGYLGALRMSERVEGLERRAVRHTLACLLARVEGRSPLEYLTPEERARQREIVVSLLERTPGSIPLLTTKWSERLEGAHAAH